MRSDDYERALVVAFFTPSPAFSSYQNSVPNFPPYSFLIIDGYSLFITFTRGQWNGIMHVPESARPFESQATTFMKQVLGLTHTLVA